ncbi:MAG: hypothetical protein MJ252_28230 [archaeon]|nr:hypothetical protein [archaeon]
MKANNALFMAVIILSAMFFSESRKLKKEDLGKDLQMIYEQAQKQDIKDFDHEKTVKEVEDIIKKYKEKEEAFKNEYRDKLEKCKNIELTQSKIQQLTKEVNENKKKDDEKCKKVDENMQKQKEQIKEELEQLKDMEQKVAETAGVQPIQVVEEKEEPEEAPQKTTEEYLKDQETELKQNEEERKLVAEKILSQYQEITQNPTDTEKAKEVEKAIAHRKKALFKKAKKAGKCNCNCECNKVNEQIDTNYDERMVECAEIQDKIFIHFQERKDNAEKIGEIIAKIQDKGGVPDYIVQNYNQVYKDSDDELDVNSFVVKKPLIGKVIKE